MGGARAIGTCRRFRTSLRGRVALRIWMDVTGRFRIPGGGGGGGGGVGLEWGDGGGKHGEESPVGWGSSASGKGDVPESSFPAGKDDVADSAGWKPEATGGGRLVGGAFARLNKLCQEGPLREAVAGVQETCRTGGPPVATNVFYGLLQRCIRERDLGAGRLVHALIVKERSGLSDYLGGHVIRMYDACGSLEEANQVFRKLSSPSVFVWAAILAANNNHGEARQALGLYREMHQSGLLADNYVLVAALKACAGALSLTDGRQVHRQVVEAGVEADVFVGNTLIDMYAKCGSMEDALSVFGRMPNRNDVTWTTMLTGYSQHGQCEEALKLFQRMREEGLQPNQVTLVRILKACASAGALDQGRVIHDYIRECGFDQNLFVGSTLIDMYSRCGSLQDARRVFDTVLRRDLVTWTSMIAAYIQHGDGEEALHLLSQMQQAGFSPDKVAVVSGLKACSITGGLEQGKVIHAYIRANSLDSNVFIGSILVDMYAKCGSVEEARSVFDTLSTRDVVTWNAMITGYALQGSDLEAIQLSQEMQLAGWEPNPITLVSILKACSSVTALDHGRVLHAGIEERGLAENAFVHSALIDMYCKSGSLEDARRCFDSFQETRDLVSWNAMIGGYVQQGDGQGALKLFRQMQEESVQADKVTLMNCLKACSSLASWGDRGNLTLALIPGLDINLRSRADAMAVERGSPEELDYQSGNEEKTFHFSSEKQRATVTARNTLATQNAVPAALEQGQLLHAQIMEKGFESDVSIRSTLIDMYAKCGSLQTARRLFERYPTRDLVAWNAMIGGYVQQGAGAEALQLFGRLRDERMEPDQVTLLSTLKACASIAALDQGRQIHEYIQEHGLESDSVVYNTLIDMYSKCGSLGDARRVFQRISKKDQVTWNAMIGACAQHGNGQEAVHLFQEMQRQGMCPDNVTFVCVLSACSHSGLVDEGNSFFRAMCQDFCITPQMEHYVCMVDLLGRSGQLEDAEKFIQDIPAGEGCVDVFRSLLGACRNHGNVELGKMVFEAITSKDPCHSAAYVLMADMYAAVGRWADEESIRMKMRSVGITKEPGRTWMEIDGEVHTFIVEDTEHTARKQIYAKLGTLLQTIEQHRHIQTAVNVE